MQNVGQPVSGLEKAQAVWRRRKWLGLLVFVPVLAATVAVARNLPDIYQSTATVLVDHPQGPGGLIGVTAAGGQEVWVRTTMQERWLRTLIQQILSRSQLAGLITRFDLYPEVHRRANPEVLVGRLRQDIQLQYMGIRQPTGEDTTITFSLSYRGRDPNTVAQVTNALAALAVAENARSRAQETSAATEFLQGQLADAERQLEAQEAQISAFKARHNGELPEQQAVNLAALERLNAHVLVIVGRRDELTRQLAELPGPAGDSIAVRLAKLNQDLAGLRVKYTDEHPDIVRVKDEIAMLTRQVGVDGGGRAAGPGGQLTNPALAAELASLRNEEEVLRRSIAVYERRVANTPLVDQELQQLSRDYTATKELYQSLLRRSEDAQLAERVQRRMESEQFRVLDPAVVPQRPVGPHRTLLLLLGLLMAGGAAVGAVLLAEAMDTSFHAVDDVRGFTSVPVLVSIPPIVTGADARWRRLQVGLACLAAAIGVAAVVGVTSHLAHSNEALVRMVTQF